MSIEIIMSADNNYAKHLATTMVSILRNTQSSVCFHIFDGNISQQNKDKILKYEQEYDCKINFYDMSNIKMPELPLNREWISIATYYRLFITDILPETVEKAIYLDCDLIVEQDIKKLWDYDIKNYLAAASEDARSLWMKYYLGLSKNHVYFNAGVLLLNLKKLREFNYKEKAFEYFIQHADIIKWQDQDILNGTFDGQCLLLPKKFNADTTLFGKYYIRTNNWSYEETLEAEKNPVIIHYTGRSKPWSSACIHPKADRYYFYFKYTHFDKDKTKFKINRFFRFIYNKQKSENFFKISVFNIPIIQNYDNKLIEKIYHFEYDEEENQTEICILGKTFYIINDNEKFQLLYKKQSYEEMEAQGYDVELYKQAEKYFEECRNNKSDVRIHPKAQGWQRDMQLANLYILKCVDKILRNNNIDYWLDSGTLLGAVRQKGFIPWDERVRISMMRDDYEHVINLINNNNIDSDIYAEYNKTKQDTGRYFNIKVKHKKSKYLAVDICPCDFLGTNMKEKEYEKFILFMKKFKSALRCNYTAKTPIEKIKQDIQKCREFVFPEKNVSDDISDLIWGIDYEHHRKNWINKHDVIFPLQEIEFEGSNFKCINDPVKYIYKTFGNFTIYPKRIGIKGNLYKKLSAEEQGIIKGIADKSI